MRHGKKSMKRYSILASIAAVGGAVAFQGSYVNLQASSPGTAQAGHSNITGTAKAGGFIGNGSQLTNLNGSEIRTGVITLTGSSPTYMIRATNNDGSPNASALIGLANSATGVTYGAWAETKSTEGRALFGYASATSGATYGSYAVNNSTGGRAAFGLAQATAGTNYGGWFQSNSPIGVGTYARNIAGGIGLRAESTGKALEVLGRATFTSSATFDGFVGIGNPSPSWPLHIVSGQNTLVRAEGTGTNGQTATGYFSTMSDIGNALYAVASPSTGSAAGLRAVSSSANGYAVHATNGNPTGYAIYGEGNGLITRNLGIGTSMIQANERLFVQDDNSNTYASSLIQNGFNPIAFASSRKALAGQAIGSGGYVTGVLATAQSTDGGNSYGLYGHASGTGSNYGVFGSAEFGTATYAGYFTGLLYATSSSAGVKAFTIDHPMDPANKVLTHSSIESDERMNIYRGVVTTDSRGYASVTVPTWFEALNEDIMYQVTVIDFEDSDSFALVKVVQDVKNGRFKIRSSTPSAKISWQISGRRHDPTSNFYPLEVEREKSPLERGKYFSPEAYGKSKELGMGYMPVSTTSTQALKKRN